jgi:1-acyl-sn-glycerol-3-phosphate acyltransferase
MKASFKPLQGLLTNELESLIAWSLPLIAQDHLRHGLQQIWVKGAWETLPAGALILASNHHSWWDLYLLWCVRERLARPFTGMMYEDGLKRFPYFRRQGIISRREVREALRRLQHGGILHLFPEGELQQAGRVRCVQNGMAFLARKASAPIYPLAIRVLMRGAEKPEALLLLGKAISSSGPGEALSANFLASINALLLELDTLLLETHPEAAVPDFETWLPKRKRFDEHMARLGRLWQH